MPKAYIGLGSNLDGPAQQVRSALAAIGRIAGVRVLAVSSLYRSPPMGPPEQPEYCNAVCTVDTRIDPAALMNALLHIEREAGRVRGGEHWGPRRIDLDLLHVEGVSCDTPDLRLPHPGLARRSFVLVPLAQVEPALSIPGVGGIAALAAADAAGLEPWPE